MRLSLRVRDRRQRGREARAIRILAAARRVFARHRIEGATMEMIARQAKVAVGTIYLHFSSRDAVYLSLAVENTERLRARYLEVKSHGLDPLQELRALAAVYIDHFRDSPEAFLIAPNTAQIRKRLRRAVEIRQFERLTRQRREVIGLFEDTVRRACDAGLIGDPLGPSNATALIWAILIGSFTLMADGEFLCELTGVDPEHFAEQMLETYLGVAGPAIRASRGARPRGRRSARGDAGHGRRGSR